MKKNDLKRIINFKNLKKKLYFIIILKVYEKKIECLKFYI